MDEGRAQRAVGRFGRAARAVASDASLRRALVASAQPAPRAPSKLASTSSDNISADLAADLAAVSGHSATSERQRACAYERAYEREVVAGRRKIDEISARNRERNRQLLQRVSELEAELETRVDAEARRGATRCRELEAEMGRLEEALIARLVQQSGEVYRRDTLSKVAEIEWGALRSQLHGERAALAAHWNRWLALQLNCAGQRSYGPIE